jgi:hypothetical protein
MKMVSYLSLYLGSSFSNRLFQKDSSRLRYPPNLGAYTIGTNTIRLMNIESNKLHHGLQNMHAKKNI